MEHAGVAKVSWNWVCPFCDRAQTVTQNQAAVEGVGLPLSNNKFGPLGLQAIAIACANPSCQEVQVTVGLHKLIENPSTVNMYHRGQFDEYALDAFEKYTLRPESSS